VFPRCFLCSIGLLYSLLPFLNWASFIHCSLCLTWPCFLTGSFLTIVFLTHCFLSSIGFSVTAILLLIGRICSVVPFSQSGFLNLCAHPSIGRDLFTAFLLWIGHVCSLLSIGLPPSLFPSINLSRFIHWLLSLNWPCFLTASFPHRLSPLNWALPSLLPFPNWASTFTSSIPQLGPIYSLLPPLNWASRVTAFFLLLGRDLFTASLPPLCFSPHCFLSSIGLLASLVPFSQCGFHPSIWRDLFIASFHSIGLRPLLLPILSIGCLPSLLSSLNWASPSLLSFLNWASLIIAPFHQLRFSTSCFLPSIALLRSLLLPSINWTSK
jgi:hypothetical protein